MIKIKGTEKELEEMIVSWLPNSGFPAVLDMVSAQENGSRPSLNGLQFQIEVEPEPELHVYDYGFSTDYGIVGTPTTLSTCDNYRLHVGDIVIIEYDDADTHWVEVRPVLVGKDRYGTEVPFVFGFFGYFNPYESTTAQNMRLTLAKSYKEIPESTRIGNITYVKS